MGLMRIPYTSPLPSPTIIPVTASSLSGAIAALYDFLSSSSSSQGAGPGTVLLTGAGISVASGLADYRGTAGTYTLNKTYRPIYFHEFCASHEARKRYWARSYLGWTNLHRSRPNVTHYAIAQLGDMGFLSGVITQNVDSFHRVAHPSLSTVELHGYLRSAVCLSCRREYDRIKFQSDLASLNPAWADFLGQMLESGALTTENPEERRRKGLKTNPDGDVDIPGVEYTTFRYPPCPACVADPPKASDGSRTEVHVDADGSWLPSSSAGVLKPNVIMFGESIPSTIKEAAETAIDSADRVLVLGSSLATYSAWRLIKRAKDSGKPIGIANLGGVRGEEQFFESIVSTNTGREGVRCAHATEKLLPGLVRALREFPSIRADQVPS
ncbi:DHS-like NAD/FAD-binding domain-containing protein [Myriangium duriaei CBS 260.36]|uniref:DHS-like NAD/FAD-binding domain-containing protein n=1 Tax=Myriangium duriaei CBS 260.36 TaxID=1168546 RepID=A0A9P4JBK8_9PEZI|nr:DHS-like NAD/FAD-binding domain-containing protein [Myriangium duriaei CBS 260.36]